MVFYGLRWPDAAGKKATTARRKKEEERFLGILDDYRLISVLDTLPEKMEPLRNDI